MDDSRVAFASASRRAPVAPGAKSTAATPAQASNITPAAAPPITRTGMFARFALRRCIEARRTSGRGIGVDVAACTFAKTAETCSDAGDGKPPPGARNANSWRHFGQRRTIPSLIGSLTAKTCWQCGHAVREELMAGSARKPAIPAEPRIALKRGVRDGLFREPAV